MRRLSAFLLDYTTVGARVWVSACIFKHSRKTTGPKFAHQTHIWCSFGAFGVKALCQFLSKSPLSSMGQKSCRAVLTCWELPGRYDRQKYSRTPQTWKHRTLYFKSNLASLWVNRFKLLFINYVAILISYSKMCQNGQN